MVVGFSSHGYTSTTVVPGKSLLTDVPKFPNLMAHYREQTRPTGQRRCCALTSLQIMSNGWHFAATPRNERAFARSRNPHDCNEYIGGAGPIEQDILVVGYERFTVAASHLERRLEIGL